MVGCVPERDHSGIAGEIGLLPVGRIGASCQELPEELVSKRVGDTS